MNVEDISHDRDTLQTPGRVASSADPLGHRRRQPNSLNFIKSVSAFCCYKKDISLDDYEVDY